MKISKSKQELARVISENGGWRDGAESAAQCKSDNAVSFYRDTPDRDGDCWWGEHLDGCDIGQDRLIANWHQSCLSRAEYFHLYPAPDADGCIKRDENGIISIEYSKDKQEVVAPGELDANGWIEWKGGEAKLAELVAACEALGAVLIAAGVEPESDVAKADAEAKPTIEQLAADYRNAKDYADRKRQEADSAKADADAKLKALELAGEAIGLLVSPITAKQEAELVITDWRDLQAGDIIELTAGERYLKTECTIVYVPGIGLLAKSAGDAENQWWYMGGPQESEWRFIRRP